MPTPQQNLATIETFRAKANGFPITTPTLDDFFAARKAIESLTQIPGFLGQGANPRDFAAMGMFELMLSTDWATDRWLNKQLAAEWPRGFDFEGSRNTDLYTRARQAEWTRLQADKRPLREVMLDRITAFDGWITTPNDRRGLTPWVGSPSKGAYAVAYALLNDPNPNVQRKLLTMLVSMPWPTSWTQEFLVNRRLFDDYIERLGASKYDTATRTGLQNLAIRARDAFRRPETFTALETVTGGGGGGGGSSGGPGIAWYRQPTGIGALMAGLAVGVLWGMRR
jgi:hypothetical protein